MRDSWAHESRFTPSRVGTRREHSTYHGSVPSMWCPEGHGEYREGFAVCAECGAALVDTPPANADPEAPNREAAHHEIVGPFLPDDDLVEVATTNAVDAELIAAQLRGSGIPAVVFGVG